MSNTIDIMSSLAILMAYFVLEFVVSLAGEQQWDASRMHCIKWLYHYIHESM